MRTRLAVRDVRALRAKYESILALRALHARARTEAGFEEPDPRAALARLAARHPGALREIDTLPLSTIRARVDELARAERDASAIAPWMIAQARFHALARGILAAKRWLREKDGPLPRAAEAWRERLAEVASPPRGRLMDLVHARVAEELGVTVREARELIFGPSRR